jgi:hypothetical protein
MGSCAMLRAMEGRRVVYRTISCRVARFLAIATFFVWTVPDIVACFIAFFANHFVHVDFFLPPASRHQKKIKNQEQSIN